MLSRVCLLIALAVIYLNLLSGETMYDVCVAQAKIQQNKTAVKNCRDKLNSYMKWRQENDEYYLNMYTSDEKHPREQFPPNISVPNVIRYRIRLCILWDSDCESRKEILQKSPPFNETYDGQYSPYADVDF
ncbi:unnamed protein product [Bursaphelenchus xylophilus]|uniref:(pine wood nematode) hypothetical protein n=1 Tax=Bursaphelenchus xylophilus TaxID=6326 RepID=A0A1I7S859_BURXY|nr:unnamed protein product [Bursaphelenchus xylophilus]CAG9080536.1 unnamed protein product [Bursaphelenchus xylophilus]